MGWHGQAKQPILQSALSVLAVVTDAQEAIYLKDAEEGCGLQLCGPD